MRQIFISNFLIITRDLRANCWVLSWLSNLTLYFITDDLITVLLLLLLNWVLLSLCRSMPGRGVKEYIDNCCIATNQTAGYCWSSQDWGCSQRMFSGRGPARSVTEPGGSSRSSCPSPSPGRWPGCACSATASAWSSSGPTVSPSVKTTYTRYSHIVLWGWHAIIIERLEVKKANLWGLLFRTEIYYVQYEKVKLKYFKL